jgi:hypothetical protein
MVKCLTSKLEALSSKKKKFIGSGIVTQKEEIRKIEIPGQPEQKVSQIPS